MVSLPAPVTASASASVSVTIPYRRTNDPAPPFTPSASSTMGSPLLPLMGGHNSQPAAEPSSIPLISPPAAYVYSTSGETNRTHIRPPLVRQTSTESTISMSYADRPPPTPPPGELVLEIAENLNDDEEQIRIPSLTKKVFRSISFLALNTVRGPSSLHYGELSRLISVVRPHSMVLGMGRRWGPGRARRGPDLGAHAEQVDEPGRGQDPTR